MTVPMPDSGAPREGDLYKRISVAGRRFTIRYGYYTDLDRESGEPIPIFPDFIKKPAYTKQGCPYCARIQDACADYSPRRARGDGWCGDCEFYLGARSEIGVCACDKRASPNAHTKRIKEDVQ